jgi:BolA family transcriptional regulator, general stress-responsive regulator
MSDLSALIQTLLRDKLSAVHVNVIDESHLHAGHAGARSGGKHFRVTVVSAAFEGKPLVARHRLVNDALREQLASGAIHALALTTKTPEER